MGPGDLAKALARLKPIVDPRLLVGPETMDDAAALRLSPDLAICLTADFITPVVDDPTTWGRIAAANSLSDIYAMGAEPLAALNLVGWPSCLAPEMLAEVLAGGAAAAEEAGCLVVGGHTVDDPQPLYGMAVLGTVHPQRLLRNQGAQPGDALYLGKPLGTGIIATAMKADLAEADEIRAAVESMVALNRQAAAAAQAAPVRALTDVSGFGLLGHLSEMLSPDGKLGVAVRAGGVPFFPGAQRLMEQGMIPAGAYRNRDAYRGRVQFASRALEELAMLLYDPQTSGGLLAAVPPEAVDRFEQEAARRKATFQRIGQFDDSGLIRVVA